MPGDIIGALPRQTVTHPWRAGRSSPDTPHARLVLKSLDGVTTQSRSAALGLHWAMASLRAHYATIHAFTPSGERAPTLIVSVPSVDGGALIDFISEELHHTLSDMATRAATTGRPVIANSRQGTWHMPCSALCVPLADLSVRTTTVGALTLLCSEPNRSWTADEQTLLATAAPLFTLQLMRARLAEQEQLLKGARAADESARDRTLAEHAAKVVHEMRDVHVDQLRAQRDEFRSELQAMVTAHEDDKRELREQVERVTERARAAEADAEATRRDAALRMHKMMEGLELQHIAELDALRDDFAARDPQYGRRLEARDEAGPARAASRSSRSASPPRSRCATAPPTPGGVADSSLAEAAACPKATQLTEAEARPNAVGAAGAAGAKGIEPRAASRDGQRTRVGRPVPAAATTVSLPPLTVVPPLDVRKGSRPLPPPPPPNWEVCEYARRRSQLCTDLARLSPHPTPLLPFCLSSPKEAVHLAPLYTSPSHEQRPTALTWQRLTAPFTHAVHTQHPHRAVRPSPT